MQNCTILEGSWDSRLQATSPQLENPTMACVCKVENFATAVRAHEVRPDVVVPHSKVSQIVDILRLVCQPVIRTLLNHFSRYPLGFVSTYLPGEPTRKN